MQPQKSILLTFDVEDWFQVENFKAYIPFSSWPERESRVERNTRLLLDVLDGMSRSRIDLASGAQPKPTPKATFFVLGWLAKRMPRLVREIHSRGHEIASHGMNHDLCTHRTAAELRRDFSDSKRILEDIIGDSVYGYRAPNFSVNENVLEALQECGYEYDSSYNSFSGNSRYGKLDLVRCGTRIASKVTSSLFELPISNIRLGKKVIPVGGGGYFRLIPALLFMKAARYIVEKEDAFLFYLHPWEVDPGQPRVTHAPAGFRFRHYVNLHKTLPRLSRLLKEFAGCRFVSCHDYIAQACGNEMV